MQFKIKAIVREFDYVHVFVEDSEGNEHNKRVPATEEAINQYLALVNSDLFHKLPVEEPQSDFSYLVDTEYAVTDPSLYTRELTINANLREQIEATLNLESSRFIDNVVKLDSFPVTDPIGKEIHIGENYYTIQSWTHKTDGVYFKVGENFILPETTDEDPFVTCFFGNFSLEDIPFGWQKLGDIATQQKENGLQIYSGTEERCIYQTVTIPAGYYELQISLTAGTPFTQDTKFHIDIIGDYQESLVFDYTESSQKEEKLNFSIPGTFDAEKELTIMMYGEQGSAIVNKVSLRRVFAL